MAVAGVMFVNLVRRPIHDSKHSDKYKASFVEISSDDQLFDFNFFPRLDILNFFYIPWSYDFILLSNILIIKF